MVRIRENISKICHRLIIRWSYLSYVGTVPKVKPPARLVLRYLIWEINSEGKVEESGKMRRCKGRKKVQYKDAF